MKDKVNAIPLIGEIIKEELNKQGKTTVWLAEQLGKSYNMVNSYVQNRQQPRLEVLNEIAKILDVDVVELIVSSKMQTNDNL